MDCLAAAHRNINAYRLPFSGRAQRKRSLAERSSRRYLIALFFMIIPLVLLQLYVWTCNNLSKRIEDLAAANKTRFVAVSDQFISLSAEPGPRGASPQWTADEGARGNRITNESIGLNSDINRMLYEANMLANVSMPFFSDQVGIGPDVILDPFLAIVDFPNSQAELSGSNRTWRLPCRVDPSSSDKLTLREIGEEASFCSSIVSPKKPWAVNRATISSNIGPITSDFICMNCALVSASAFCRRCSAASTRSRSVFSCRSASSNRSYVISASGHCGTKLPTS